MATYHVGGRFGIVNPVIAGNTMFLANSYGWVIALPLNEIFPSYQSYWDGGFFFYLYMKI
ncbi:MAG: hypothetical protein RRA45_09515 [Saccharolobus sp.]|uniref:hypothetical protein n=1 Tax=Saccharolobus sp. TaxID=2100761 RepID=UPI0028CD4AF5|nr:hypothetical protein [Saccharolobus sp.]MDT7862437.1 hypothetical protein [Saccharolobus sp.]